MPEDTSHTSTESSSTVPPILNGIMDKPHNVPNPLRVLISECEKVGADVDRQLAISTFHKYKSQFGFNQTEALQAVERDITQRCGLPKTITYGPISPPQ